MSPKMSTTGQPIVEFTAMKDGTYEDYQLIERLAEPVQAHVGEHLLQLLKMLDAPDEHIGHPISRYQHSLQSATRALRAGEDDEMVVAALLHDVGDVVAPHNHPEAAAAILRPFVSERVAWIVEKHGVFQGLYYYEHIGLDKNAREKYRGHPWFDDCAKFCEDYDQCSFDPHYDTLPLETFEPIVRRVFAQPWAGRSRRNAQ
jgi:predicted HD phosphohydrolase